MSNENLTLEQIIKEEYEKLLNEFVVPVGFSLSDWKAFRKKHSITNAEYHKKHPRRKWKVVHGHKEGHIGEPLKGMSKMSYRKATKAHAAIAMRNEQVTPIAGINAVDVAATTLTPIQKQTKEIVDIISKNSTIMTKLKLIDTPEELDSFLESITQLVVLSNNGGLNPNEIDKAVKYMYATKLKRG
jgi:hypothetical protein